MLPRSDAAMSQREERIKLVYQDKSNRSVEDFLRSIAHSIMFTVVVEREDEENVDENDDD